jgi:hypothetical protein
LLIPLIVVKGMTLDTKVKDLIPLLPYNYPDNSEDIFNMREDVYSKFIPRDMPIGRVYFLDKPVYALTTRRYLESVHPESTLSQLAIEPEGEYFPYNPNNIAEISSD